MPITYSDWKKVSNELKEKVWTDIKKFFQYSPDQFNEALCRGHALFVTGRGLHTLQSRLVNNYVKKGKSPLLDYTFIKQHVWDEFVEKNSTDEVKAKSKKFTELAKKNELSHHLGMTGYAGKRPKWRQQEREAEASGQSYPLQGIDERTRDLFYGREPKKVKEGMTKYNNPKIEEAEKSLLMIKAAKEHGEFVPHRGHNELTEALGNPEHRDRVWGVSSRQSWKNVESWQSDTASYHTRKSYKEGIFQAGKEAAVKEMIIGSIKDAFTSTDPQMVELRTQMFR
jgi:hypothetical protein